MKDRIKKFHSSLLLNPTAISKARRKISIVVFYFILISTAITIIGQIPAFSSRGLTKFFQVGWLLVIVPIIFLDYRHFLRCLLNCLIIAVPFLIYLFIALACGNKAISYGGTIYIFLSLYLFLIGIFLGKYYNINLFKNVALSFIIGAFIYAFVVLIVKLVGNSIGSEIYAFDDKNSAGPIFFIAALLSFFFFSKKNLFDYFCKIGLFCFFSLVIVLGKCRATIIYIPIALLVIHIFIPTTTKNRKISSIIFGGGFTVALVLILVVPQLRETVIVKILLNNKKSIQEALSGRIEQIVYHFKNFKPALGSGGSYFDCMPLSFLVTYGIIGFISLIPLLAIPFYSSIKSFKIMKDTLFSTISLLISGLMLFNSIFEGYGFIGTGTKVFMFWILNGYSLCKILEFNASKAIVQKVDILPKKASTKISKTTFLILTQIFIISISGVLISSTALVSGLGEKIIKGFDTGSKDNTVSAEKIDIHQDTYDLLRGSGLCVGQKIKLKTTVEPKNSNNYYASWEKAWHNPSYIFVESNKDILHAKKVTLPSTSIVQVFIKGEKNSKYIEFCIFDPNDYKFNKAMIDVKPFDVSFDKSDINEINLEVNQSSKVYYDDNYIPQGVPFSFVSSDETIASIDPITGVINANGLGTCKVYGLINNSKGEFKTNEITINVKERTTTYSEVTSLDIELPNEIYQHQPFTINTKFNEGASDTSYDISLNENTKYTIENNELTINTFGDNDLTIVSRSNPNVKCKKKINVIKNYATKFTCENNWLILGEVKNTEQIGLYLNYSNGYKKIVKEKDLSYNKREITNKNGATSERSGFINNSMMTISATKTGSFTATYTNSDDAVISTDITFKISAMTKENYETTCKAIGLIIFITILLILTASILLFNVDNLILIIFSLIYAIIVTTMLFVFYSVNIYTIIFVSILALAIFIFSVIRILFLDEFDALLDK